jgi:2-keto-4-pentenoate hydratase/2-oxohepta-3-ene-1,7-dioic acid hydratase in catechol pathway
MRLLRIGPVGHETPAVLVAGRDDLAHDLSSLTDDIDGAFLSGNFQGQIVAAIATGDLPTIELSGRRIGAPIARPHAIYAIGLNYVAHAEEARADTAVDLPPEPLVFTKAPNSICGPHDDITLPPGSARGDWEVELGVVVATRCWQLTDTTAAAAAIAGYVAADDVSERDWQLERSGQWMKGKSFPTANPTGPWLVTPDEIDDPADLTLRLAVNSQLRQHGNTADLVFDPSHLIWYLSQFVQLEPGDLIDTGTPDGVGLGMRPPVFLQDGDVIELSITGLGAHRNTVRIPEPAPTS